MTARSSIRPMVEADLSRVFEIAQSLDHAPHWPLAAYQDALQPDSSPRRIALALEDSATQRVAAFAIVSLLPPQAELELIAVAAEHQRQGLARLLFAALYAELKSAAITELQLEVRASNHPALALYRSLGFEQTALRPRYYAHPVDDAILMQHVI